jgi:hypothetical protein
MLCHVVMLAKAHQACSLTAAAGSPHQSHPPPPFPLPARSYAALQPLHELWRSYSSSAVEASRAPEATLLQVDLHGALLHVTRARQAGHVGTAGIVLKDTRNAFHIVTEANVTRGGSQGAWRPGLQPEAWHQVPVPVAVVQLGQPSMQHISAMQSCWVLREGAHCTHADMPDALGTHCCDAQLQACFKVLIGLVADHHCLSLPRSRAQGWRHVQVHRGQQHL